ncbi:hypothetical protein D3C87_1176620 [compost metagenome]
MRRIWAETHPSGTLADQGAFGRVEGLGQRQCFLSGYLPQDFLGFLVNYFDHCALAIFVDGKFQALGLDLR